MLDFAFASDFPRVDPKAWRALVEKVLKGVPYDAAMVARTRDGLTLDALQPRARNRSPIAPARTAGTPWTIMARVDHPDAAAANAQALEDLNGGASGLALVLAGSGAGFGFGLEADGTEAIERALDGVRLDLIETRIEAAPFRSGQAAGLLAELVARRGHAPGDIHIDFGLDPLGHAALTGAMPGLWADISLHLSGFTRTVLASGFKGTILRADTRIHHDAGAGAAQELAAGLASTMAYLRALDERGIDIDALIGRIEMSLSADADQFETVAKLRAARLLWASGLRELGCTFAPLRIHAETSWRMATQRDPHVNLLRNAIAGFAAGVGGADSLSVLPFTQALGLPDGAARRLARNAQVILIEEANVHRVADPGAGSGMIETFTDALAAQAWDLFRAIERRGGMAEALASGWWQGEVAAVRDARLHDVATGKSPIIGTSEYTQQFEAALVSVLQPLPPAGAASLTGAFPPLRPMRLAEGFEALRATAETEEQPKAAAGIEEA